MGNFMPLKVQVKKSILQWAMSRAGITDAILIKRFPYIREWIEQTKQPTVNQLAKLSKFLHLPFGYFLLKEPPSDTVSKAPIPYFRTVVSDNTQQLSLNVIDTIKSVQSRQLWVMSKFLNFFGIRLKGFPNKKS